MNILADMAVAAAPVNGETIVRPAVGAAICFPVADNPRPTRGLVAGDHGQFQRKPQA